MAVAAENCQITFSSNACGTLLLNLKKKGCRWKKIQNRLTGVTLPRLCSGELGIAAKRAPFGR
jgi:hypothetical protein